MSDNTKAALDGGGIADIITVGRKSGQPRSTEIHFRQLDSKLYISGTASARDWVANLKANPNFVLKLNDAYAATVSATARQVTDLPERRRIHSRLLGYGLEQDTGSSTSELEQLVANGLLIQFTIEESIEPAGST